MSNWYFSKIKICGEIVELKQFEKKRMNFETLDIKTFDILSLFINDKMSNEIFSKEKLAGRSSGNSN